MKQTPINQFLHRFVPLIMALALLIVGLINFVTGIVPLFNLHNDPDLAQYSKYLIIVSSQQTSDILSIFLGLALIALGFGLYHRRKAAWCWAFVILCLALINSLYGQFVIQTFLASIIYMLLLLIFRKDFQRISQRRMTATQTIAWLSVIFAMAYGIIGSYLLRAQFHGIHNWIDAVYYTLVTYSTLGYGDIVPKTMNAKIFTSSMVIIGVSSFVAALSVLIGPIIENRLKGVLNIMGHLRKLKGHIIICGYSPMSLYTAEQLLAQGKTCLFVVDSNDLVNTLRVKGFFAISGDSTDRETLAQANLVNAKTLISTFTNDADNILTVMAADGILQQQPQKKVTIICRIDQKQNINKAKRVGANQVISPAILGGDLMVEQALKQA